MLHQIAHAEGVRTLSIGIPPSGYAARHPPFEKQRSDANALIRAWCDAEADASGLCRYVDAPIAYEDASASAGETPRLWEPDGLHLSSEGYRSLGELLAPSVASAVLEAQSTCPGAIGE